MDQIYFKKVCEQVTQSERDSNGIGTLSEKTVHAVLKRYLEPDQRYHEQKIEGFYADVCNGREIIEIQIAHFDKLRRKLEVFLERMPVNVVYPIPHRKILRWIDEETGEITNGRKSPKTGTPHEVFRELYKIRPFLQHENLRLTILLIDMEEYRFLNGWSRDRKRGSVRAERIPLALEAEYHIDTPLDYSILVPDALPEQFTVKEYQKQTRVSAGTASKALLLLYELGAVERIGKQGRAWLYRRSESHILNQVSPT